MARACVLNRDEAEGGNVIVVYSRSTTHPSCPEKTKNFRVKDYWSVMTIKPSSEFDKMGIEFSLTAFENPGLSLPSSITTWVAIRGMPEFMANLRKACFEMRKWKIVHQGQNNNVRADITDKASSHVTVGSPMKPASKSSHSSQPSSQAQQAGGEPSYMETPTQYPSSASNQAYA